MKKIYMTPSMEIENLKVETALLDGSNITLGGEGKPGDDADVSLRDIWNDDLNLFE